MKKNYKGAERREFARLEFTAPLAFKVCKKQTISTLLDGYTSDISKGGLFCRMDKRVKKGDILWLSFDKATLGICEEIDRRSLVYQNGIIGKVVRIESRRDKAFNVGIQFITREEKNLSNIYPKVHFLGIDGGVSGSN